MGPRRSRIITVAADIAPRAAIAVQPRARGLLRVAARHDRGASRLADLRQEGSLKALFPRGSGDALQAVFLNTAGGLTGGDRMRIGAEAGPGAHLVLSSQAAERGYRAGPGEVAQVAVTLRAGAGGRIDWLPQETILFEGAALSRRLSVDLHPEARALVVEPVILGRAAMGEDPRAAALADRWDLRRDGALVFADALRMAGDLAALCDRRAVAGGCRAFATLLYAGPDAAAPLADLRRLLGPSGGASLVSEGVLFARIAAPDGFLLRRRLIPAIERLSVTPLPKVWSL